MDGTPYILYIPKDKGSEQKSRDNRKTSFQPLNRSTMTLVVAAMLAMLAGTVDKVAARETTGIMSDSSNLKHHTLTQRNLGEKTTEKRGGRSGCNDGVV